MLSSPPHSHIPCRSLAPTDLQEILLEFRIRWRTVYVCIGMNLPRGGEAPMFSLPGLWPPDPADLFAIDEYL